MEDALQIMTVYEESNFRKNKQSSGEDESPKLSFAQRGNRVCYECGKEGHIRRKCPELKKGISNVQAENENEKKVAFKDESIGWAG